jgi:hypothetical protein
MPEDVYRGTVYTGRGRRRPLVRAVALVAFVVGLIYVATTAGMGL